MMELLLAMREDMKANQEKIDSSQAKMEAERKTDRENLKETTEKMYANRKTNCTAL
jgi:hypothetical protein